MDDDGLSCAAYINLCCAGDVQVPQVLLQLRVGRFQVEKSLHEILQPLHTVRQEWGQGMRLATSGAAIDTNYAEQLRSPGLQMTQNHLAQLPSPLRSSSVPVSCWHRKLIGRTSATQNLLSVPLKLRACAVCLHGARADGADEQYISSTGTIQRLKLNVHAASHHHFPQHQARGAASPVSAEFAAISSRQGCRTRQRYGSRSG